jgi:hypothetical protein
MTTLAPDLDTIDHLDFDPAIPCECYGCAKHPEAARSAVMLSVTTMPCHTDRAPICHPCREQAKQWIEQHVTLLCRQHGGLACCHVAIRFEPLP